MNCRRLGNTTLVASEIGLGCQSLGGGLYYRDDREATNVLRRSVDAGINFFDTADHYSLGRSEALIGRALRGRRHELVFSTKVGTTYTTLAAVALRARRLLRPLARALRGQKLRLHHLRASQRRWDFRPAYLVRAVEASLRRLRTDYVDLLMLHKPPVSEIVRGESFEALARLRAAGKIRYFGVSCDGIEDARAALGVAGLSAIQVTVNLLDQSALAEILPRAQRQGCGVIARNPRGQGHLTDTFDDILAETYVRNRAEARERVKAARAFGFLARDGRTMAQAAIQFVRAQSGVSVVVPRVVNLRQLDEVLATHGAPALSPQEMARIAATSASIRDLVRLHPFRQHVV